MNGARATIRELQEAVRTAVAELDDEHRPLSSDPLDAAEGRVPIGCVVCWPGDSKWPCITRMIADDLRTLVPAAGVADEANPPGDTHAQTEETR